MSQKIFNVIIFYILSYNVLAQPTLEILNTPIYATNISDVSPSHLTKGKNNSGISCIFFDAGNKVNENIPEQPYKLIHFNLMNSTYDVVPIIKNNNINSPQSSMGLIWKAHWSKNGKLYFSSNHPEHVVEFNPYNNQVYDRGSILKKPDGTPILTYSFGIGMDSALYGGSGTTKHLVTFRHDAVNNTFETHNDFSLDNENDYVLYVTGDKDYTYTVVGKTKYRIYAFHRATKVKTLLRERSDGGVIALRLVTKDTVYFDEYHPNSIYKSWKVYGNNIVARPDNDFNFPNSMGISPILFNPIPEDTSNYPQIFWNEDNKKVVWRFKNDTSLVYDKTINEFFNQRRTTNTLVALDSNTIFGNTKFYGKYYKYNISSQSLDYFGKTESIYSIISKNKIAYIGTYGGSIFRYNPDSATTDIPSFNPVPKESINSNPRRVINVRHTGNPDPLKLGPALLSNIAFFDDSTIIFCGPIDTDGKRAGSGSSIGKTTFSGNVTHCFDSLLSHTYLTNGVLGDSKKYYCSSYDDGNNNQDVYIYKYDPVNNHLEKRIHSPNPVNTGTIVKSISNQLVLYNKGYIHFLSEISDEIYKSIELDIDIIKLKLGYDDMLWAFGKGTQNNYSFYRINPKDGKFANVFSFLINQDTEGYNDFIFIGGNAYLSGNKNLGVVNNLYTPNTNSYLSNFERLNSKFSFETCE